MDICVFRVAADVWRGMDEWNFHFDVLPFGRHTKGWYSSNAWQWKWIAKMNVSFGVDFSHARWYHSLYSPPDRPEYIERHADTSWFPTVFQRLIYRLQNCAPFGLVCAFPSLIFALICILLYAFGLSCFCSSVIFSFILSTKLFPSVCFSFVLSTLFNDLLASFILCFVPVSTVSPNSGTYTSGLLFFGSILHIVFVMGRGLKTKWKGSCAPAGLGAHKVMFD